MLTVHSNASIQNSILQDYKSSYGIDSKHEVIAEWNLNAYLDVRQYGLIDPNGNIIKSGQHFKYYDFSGSATAGVDIDYDRMNATPLYSLFDYKTTDSNIYGIVSSRFDSTASLTTSSTSLRYLKSSLPRFYPISKNSSNKFWSSSRIIQNSASNGINNVGVADGSGNISYSDVFIQYTASARINKIKIRSQYYLSFPSKFTVYKTTSTGDSPTWTKIYEYTGTEANSTLSSGDLDLYYNPTTSSWVLTTSATKYITDISISGNQTDTITGIRLKVDKIYSPDGKVSGRDLQLLEISPRIICDISQYTKSFDIKSSISEMELGLPVGGIISSNGTIVLSNVDKYFSPLQNLSIVSKYLYPNVKFSISAIVTKNSEDVRIPIKTLYSNSWQEDDEGFQTSIEVEDYMKFFKSTPSPDMVFANKRGIPSSVAILCFLDNIGYGKYKFVSNLGLNEDPTMQFFFSRKENTVAQTLQEMAVSCQLAMFMDANNNFTVMTKERATSPVSNSNVSWWMVGDRNNVGVDDPEYSYITSGSYISNISSFSKTIQYPITDMQIEYSGLGLQKSPEFLKDLAEVNKLDSLTKGDLSLLSDDMNYVVEPLWRASDNDEENTIFSTILAQKIEGSVPSVIADLSSTPYKINAENEYDAIRRFYDSLNQSDKNKLHIKFDNLNMQLLAKNKSYTGYFNIDNETIRYKGIQYSINSSLGQIGASILFSDTERLQLESSPGVYLTPINLILYLDFDIDDPTASLLFVSNTLKKYTLKSHGRAAKTYKNSGPISEHLVDGISSSWSTINTIKIFDSATKTISTQVTLNKSTKKKSVNGYTVAENLTMTGLNLDLGSAEVTSGSINGFPTLYNVEKYISGIGISSKIGYNVLSTRLKLILKSSDNKDYVSGNAGIFFGLKGDGTSNATGYFVELISFGATANAKKLQDADFENLYLYKIITKDGQLQPEILGKKVVTTARVPEVSYYNSQNPDSKAIVSDLRVVISSNKIKVYWEDHLAIVANRDGTKIFDGTSMKSGLFVRGNTKALFDYFLATSENDGQTLKNYGMIDENDAGDIAYAPNVDLYTAAKNKTISAQSVTQNTLLNSETKSTFYDDFGKVCREVKRFKARFDAPVLLPQIAEYGSNLGRYKIVDFKPTAFGAEFWMVNCCCDTLKLGEDSSVPLMIIGYKIKKSTNEDLSVKIDDLIGLNENKFNIDSSSNDIAPVFLNVEKNKEKYGLNSLSLQAEFISSQKEATELANWIMKNASSEKMSISVDAFANPLLEIGDKVKFFYKDKGICQKVSGEKTFVISSIGYSVENAGPKMSLELRECLNG